MAYTSEALSLAALELFVHLEVALLPEDLVAVEVLVPDGVVAEELPVERLPPGWGGPVPPPELHRLGREWVASRRSLLLRVPSVLVPREWNVLVNPAHPDVGRLTVVPPRPFRFDARMLKG